MSTHIQEKIILRADKWVNNGFCLGYLDGDTYFISGAIPNELVECIPVSLTKKFKHIKVIRVIENSPQRISPDCDIFLLCGGCTFRHIPYSNELELKKNLFLSEFNHKFPYTPIISSAIQLISGNELRYRNNVQFKIQGNKKGFFKFGSNDLIEFPKKGCLNLPDELNQFINELPIQNKKEGKLRFANKVFDYENTDSEFTFGKKKVKVPKNGFFQINRYLIEKWLDEIIQFIPTANLNILELFSGSGLISLSLADHVSSLIGYELESNAVNYANENAKINRIQNLAFHTRNLYLEKISQKYLDNPLWIMNPPRNGLGNLIINQIVSHKPQYIIYSSCNYQSLIQDLKRIIIFYSIQKISIVDFFPRTPYFVFLVICIQLLDNSIAFNPTD
jgi:23S rRNA (uracil1939-C5)-methyltransferase